MSHEAQPGLNGSAYESQALRLLRVRVRPELRVVAISSDRSMARAECVSAPMETKSTPSLRQAREPLQGDAARDLERHPARRELHGLADLLVVHVVEHHHVRAAPRCASSSCWRLVTSISIFTSRGACAWREAKGLLDGAAHRRDVVVLDEDAIEEPEAVVGSTARADGVLRQRAHARETSCACRAPSAWSPPRPSAPAARGWRCRTVRWTMFSAVRSATSSERSRP